MMPEEAQSTRRRKLILAAARARAHLPAGLPPVFFMTDTVRTPDPCAIANRLPRGWGIIYRSFGAAGRAEMAARLARIARARRLVLLIANDPAMALACGADGVHWPFAARQAARNWRGRFALMTVSAHSPREMWLARRGPFGAVVVSAVFASASPSAGNPSGPIRLRGLARAGRQPPIYALGGVSSANAARVAGFVGLAAISGLSEAFD